MSIEVRCTSVSPLRTCINSAIEHVVCTENFTEFFEYNFLVLLSLSLSHAHAYTVCLSNYLLFCVYSVSLFHLMLPHVILHNHVFVVLLGLLIVSL